ncbi:flagellar basal body protein [Burkholderia sp. AU29985]|nr:hypothetical protein XM57_21990 [Burkholderia cepacia]AYZ94339.1 flagellar basal body protein [Burkholderia dolosa]ETP63611.1 flagellar basal body-associated protein FliL [Burkholderia dolosa PC543]PRE41254.1 flagellar basal body protein [Burkholderia sp. AU12872]PUA76938.1 flagellar basal body protein [Burkholderia sp. AU29985]
MALGGAGAAVLLTGGQFGGTAAPKAAADVDTARYVSLDKLVVMLKADGAARPRYMSIDLVFTAATEKSEKRVREQLPLLRALSYQALSEYSAADVLRMRPTDMSDRLNGAFAAAFGTEEARPFTDVLVAKVMVD